MLKCETSWNVKLLCSELVQACWLIPVAIRSLWLWNLCQKTWQKLCQVRQLLLHMPVSNSTNFSTHMFRGFSTEHIDSTAWTQWLVCFGMQVSLILKEKKKKKKSILRRYPPETYFSTDRTGILAGSRGWENSSVRSVMLVVVLLFGGSGIRFK